MVGAAAQAQDKKYTIALIPGLTTDAFYITMRKGAEAAAKALGAELVFQGAPEFNPVLQVPVLDAVIARKPDAILIDGYVWLDGKGRRGLGAHFYEELGLGIPVIGAAKTRFAGAETFAEQVVRGRSTNPLWVTAAGMDADEAAANVRSMHGEHRIPTLVALADRLARQACSP